MRASITPVDVKDFEYLIHPPKTLFPEVHDLKPQSIIPASNILFQDGDQLRFQDGGKAVYN